MEGFWLNYLKNLRTHCSTFAMVSFEKYQDHGMTSILSQYCQPWIMAAILWCMVYDSKICLRTKKTTTSVIFLRGTLQLREPQVWEPPTMQHLMTMKLTRETPGLLNNV